MLKKNFPSFKFRSFYSYEFALLIFKICAGIILVALARRATFSADVNWDTIGYHMPFSARLVGICSRNCFLMTPWLEACYQGFPKTIELLQGVIWKLTDRTELMKLPTLLSVLILILYLEKGWSVPWQVSTLGFFCIPLVMIHSTSAYIDLLPNVAVTISLLILMKTLLSSDKISKGDIFLFFGMLAVAGNSKLQLIPVITLIFIFFCIVYLKRKENGNIGTFIILLFLFLPSVGWAIYNILKFGNPAYPIKIAIAGFEIFPGPIDIGKEFSGPDYLAAIPKPIRWLLSILEFRAFDNRYTPWNIDQGAVKRWVASSDRMGGYFNIYVLGVISLIIASLRNCDFNKSKTIIIYLFSITFIVSFLPASHELRYYMFWMLVLVSIMLILNWSKFFATQQHNFQKEILFLIFITLTSVISLSGGRYLIKTDNLESVMAKEGINNYVENKISSGSIICINENNRAFLYTSIMHNRNDYLVIQGSDDRCDINLIK